MERFIEIIVGAAKSCLLFLILISPLLILIAATSHIRAMRQSALPIWYSLLLTTCGRSRCCCWWARSL
jgi:hypothetical protein